AAQAGAWGEAAEPVTTVLLPVGIGIVAGIAVVSNLLKMVLERYPRATLGVLFGLLLGAVVGLWPFQQGVPPEAGELLRGDRVAVVEGHLVFETTGRPVEAKHYP